MIETEPRAFVAGATGLTGRAVVAELCARGVDTVAHVRPDSPSLEAWRERFAAMGARVDATPWEEAALTATLRELAPRVVFALLGTTRKRAKRAAASGRDPAAESYEAVDYGLTAMLRRACEASGHRPRFVYLSATMAKEGTSNPYMAARVRIERELKEGSLPYVIARPSFILGERDEPRPGEKVGASMIDAALGVLGALGARKLRDRYASIDAADLGRALARLGLHESAQHVIAETDALRRAIRST
ncbi:MAG: NAD(P)H-binding protein [Sandaracinaceae bacterium]|nr:NAD(P)H-binding protein [Sandaracinaceae bacterium]